MSQTLSFGLKSKLTKGEVNSSKQAILIRSGVAGVSKGNHFLPRPTSARAALIASLIAKKTDDARKNGGSPTAFDECIPFEFGFPLIGNTSWVSFLTSKYKVTKVLVGVFIVAYIP